ncbi:MAG: hypothetical protein P8144_10150 [Gammaproteobacteria bacterium]
MKRSLMLTFSMLLTAIMGLTVMETTVAAVPKKAPDALMAESGLKSRLV